MLAGGGDNILLPGGEGDILLAGGDNNLLAGGGDNILLAGGGGRITFCWLEGGVHNFSWLFQGVSFSSTLPLSYPRPQLAT